MVEWILNFAISFMSGNPYFGTFLMLVGILRVAFKPVMTVIQVIVDNTETKVDDKAVSAFVGSSTYKGIIFILDWFASIKLPKK